MSTDDLGRARPISMVSRRDGTMSPSGRPTLDDVLANRAPAPYTLAAYTAFLSQQHCLETLEFVTEAKKYSMKYDESAAHYCGMPFTTESDEGFELMQDWLRLLDIYVKPGAPREINLPAEERDDLVDYPYEPKPPLPEALEPAVKRMYDLMSDSIFIPFCNSMKTPAPSMQTYNTLAEIAAQDSPRMSFHDRLPTHRRQNSRRRRSPPTTSGAPLEPSRSPQQRQGGTSTLTAALNRTSSARLSTHISHSSAASDSFMSDDSSTGYAPHGEPDALMSPPITPPQSELPFHTSATRSNVSSSAGQRPIRSESGGWKKMGMKFFGGKKKT